MKQLIFVLALCAAHVCSAQLIVKNNTGILMHVDTDGMVGFRTTEKKGLVNIDSLGHPYSFHNAAGNNTIGKSCLFIDAKDNLDYSQAVKQMAIHAFAHADATPSTSTEARQNIAISAHLYNGDRTKTIGVANLGENWSLGPQDPTRRDITIVKGSLQNPDEVMDAPSAIRRISAVEGSVRSDRNTIAPDKVYAGYFSGAKTFVAEPLYVGRNDQIGGEIGEPHLSVYSTTENPSAKLRLRGSGDGIRYANIQLARTQDEKKWILNYRQPESGDFERDLLFTYYNENTSDPDNGYDAVMALEHDTHYLNLHQGGLLINETATPNPNTIPNGHVLIYVAGGDLKAMDSSGNIVNVATF